MNLKEIALSIQSIAKEEYERSSLWYFAFFIFGIILFFTYQDYLTNNYILLFSFLVSVLFYKISSEDNLLLRFAANLIIMICLGLIIGNLRMFFVTSTPITQEIKSDIQGKISSIKPTTHGTQITLDNVVLEKEKFLKKVRVNISKKLYKEFDHGDTVKLRARLFPLQEALLPGAYDFDFFMKMSGIEASGYALTSPEIIKQNEHFFSSYIKNLRTKIYNRLIEILGNDAGNFASAILIGETKAIPLKISENMRNTGISHILSVSGLHLSLVAMIFFISSRMMLNLSNFLAYNTNIKILSAIISIIGSFFYLQISGSNIAATRAFVMTAIFIIAIIMGRSPYPLRSVVIAAFFILSFKPEYIFHPSFQLSFAAVLCLISGYEFFSKYKHLIGYDTENKGSIIYYIKFYIYTNIYTSFLASVVTAPFVIYHFYKFATYSILMNLIAVPIMSFFMMPLAILSLVLMPFGIDAFFLKILGFFINIIINISEYIVELPNAILVIGHISEQSLTLFSIGFFWICFWKTRIKLIGILIILISIIFMFITKTPDFIYNHKLKLVGVKNNEGKLEIYGSEKISQFVLNYWNSWYGQDSLIFHENTNFKDTTFFLNSEKTVSLSYSKCINSDFNIVISETLKCPNNKNYISYNEIQKVNKIMF